VSVDTPSGTIERPQVVLVSNNPYHIASPRHLGRRFALDGGLLGAIVVKGSPGSAPPPLPHLVRDLGEGGEQPGLEGLITWSAPRVTLHGSAPTVVAGVDGESATLPLPLTCEIRPAALCVLLPVDRPGVPREPQPLRLSHLPGHRRRPHSERA